VTPGSCRGDIRDVTSGRRPGAPWRTIALGLIRAGRAVLKNTPLERNRAVIALHDAVFRLAFRRADRIEVEYRGCRLLVPGRDPTIVPGVLNGTYERHEMDFYERTVRPGMTVLDVGAHVGLYSVIGARRVGPTGRVFSFEPVPATIEFLRQNVERSGAGNVTIVPKAVGSTASRVRINWSPDRLGASSAARSGERHIDVDVVSLDEFCSAENVAPDFVKIDVEGGELDVLAGMRQVLSGRPVVLMEMNIPLLEELHRNPDEYLRTVLARFGSVRFIDETTGGLRPLRRLEDVGHQIIANLVLSSHRDDD
jgi:FkbM family methyltransferase